jgi:hypothetical protein
MLVMVAAVVKADVAVVVGFGAIKASAELTSIIHRIVVLSRVENTIFLKNTSPVLNCYELSYSTIVTMTRRGTMFIGSKSYLCFIEVD